MYFFRQFAVLFSICFCREESAELTRMVDAPALAHVCLGRGKIYFLHKFKYYTNVIYCCRCISMKYLGTWVLMYVVSSTASSTWHLFHMHSFSGHL